ncbi:hypothetical protein [Paremcibacter congregatus]|uniref:hypothetical protein n=1 Tax=Paremcibacter congregatus TaxID=2043170 RepID=UPI003A9245F4
MVRNFANLVLLIGLLALVGTRILMADIVIQPDSSRYASAGLNIYEHGVLSRQGYREDQVPEPGLYAGGIFTAWEIALAAKLDEQTYRDLVCVAKGAVSAECGLGLSSLKAIYYVETVVFHLCMLFVGWLFFGRSLFAGWCCVIASLAFYDTFLYASSPLSESGYLMLGGLFMASWAYAYERASQWSVWALAGVFAGLLVMVKPAWLLLPVGLLIIPVAAFFRYRESRLLVLKSAAIFLMAFILVVSPMMVRNVIELGTFSLSDTSYLVSSLSHRFAFNLMSWQEWFIGWIYYLPLSGARVLFGTEVLLPLGWGEQSYYQYGRDTLDALANSGRTPLEARNYLISQYVFAMPIKFIAVSLLLLWRGIFVGHLVGMVAVPSVAAFMLFARKVFLWRWAYIFLPALFMASVNAALSVSLYRYNLTIIIPYCLAMVWIGFAVLNFLLAKFDHSGFRAMARRFLPATR